MSEEQKRLLEKQLWGVANVLRGKMNADEYKNYILGFIFYKYLSEKLERYVNEKLLVRDKITFAEIKENTKEGKEYLKAIETACVGHLGFFLKPTELFSYLVKKGKGNIDGQKTFILEDLKNIFNSIEQTSMGTASEDDFKGLFDDVDLTSSKLGSSEKKKNDVIVEVLTLLKGIDFKLEDSKSDLLGDAYEYLIGEFAAGAGKKGGEFYTPAQVSRLLAQIVSVDKKRVRSVFDPTCGSGSLLLRLKDYTEVSDYYGQELNPTTYNLARMNMILHGIHFDHFKIKQGDTLTEDLHPDLKAEAVIANPPFSAEWKSENDPQLAHDDRFSQYGRLAPKSFADYAFVTHMLYHLAENGTMAIILPHGALSRVGAEESIRKYIIEKQNYLDAVIGLPANLFYGTNISATILVFKKCRKDNEDILFIDASKEFEKGKNQNKLTDENISKIFSVYKDRKEIKKYSHRALLNEIKDNEYDLNIPRYIDTFEEADLINIEFVCRQLKKLKELEQAEIDKINAFCTELKIPKPDGNNIPLLKQFKKGIMHGLFFQTICFKNGAENFPAWNQKSFTDVFQIESGSNKKNEDEGKYFNLTMGSVSEEGKLLISSKTNISNNLLHKNQLIMPTRDIGRGFVIGRTALIDKDDVYVAGNCLFALTAIDDDPEFLNHLFNSDYMRKKIRRIVCGTSQMQLTLRAIKKLTFTVPNKAEQHKIAMFLTLIDRLIEIKNEQVVSD